MHLPPLLNFRLIISSCFLDILNKNTLVVIMSVHKIFWIQSSWPGYFKELGKVPSLKALPTTWQSALPGSSHKSDCDSVLITCTGQKVSKTFSGLNTTLETPRSESASNMKGAKETIKWQQKPLQLTIFLSMSSQKGSFLNLMEQYT